MKQLRIEFKPGSAVTARHLQLLNALAETKHIGLYKIDFAFHPDFGEGISLICFPVPLGSIPRHVLEEADYCVMNFKM